MSKRLAEETIAPDEESVIKDFLVFLHEVTEHRAKESGEPLRRFNQTRAAGCVDAAFVVPADLPASLKVGLFATAATYQARVRFANAATESDRDVDLRGMSIKVMNVPGTNLSPGVSDQDFVLNSHPVMMASDTKGFLEFNRAVSAVDRDFVDIGRYFVKHPKVLAILTEARQHHSSHLDIPYFSATPYLFGEGRAVKYVVRPTSPTKSPKPPLRPSKTYLTDELIARLAAGDATFDLCVQFQTDAEKMPIEDAMVEWEEKDSPYLRVATIRIPKQRFDAAEQWQACEALRFSPWHALEPHRPLGGMNRARRPIYYEMGKERVTPR